MKGAWQFHKLCSFIAETINFNALSNGGTRLAKVFSELVNSDHNIYYAYPPPPLFFLGGGGGGAFNMIYLVHVRLLCIHKVF